MTNQRKCKDADTPEYKTLELICDICGVSYFESNLNGKEGFAQIANYKKEHGFISIPPKNGENWKEICPVCNFFQQNKEEIKFNEFSIIKSLEFQKEKLLKSKDEEFAKIFQKIREEE